MERKRDPQDVRAHDRRVLRCGDDEVIALPAEEWSSEIDDAWLSRGRSVPNPAGHSFRVSTRAEDEFRPRGCQTAAAVRIHACQRRPAEDLRRDLEAVELDLLDLVRPAQGVGERERLLVVAGPGADDEPNSGI